MKPTPKKNLDDYLEAEFAEAEAVAEVEEAQRKVSPYRVDQDLSHRLNIPRDVTGLVELLEERKKTIEYIEHKYSNIDKNIPHLVFYSGVVGLFVGAYYENLILGGGLLLAGMVGSLGAVFLLRNIPIQRKLKEKSKDIAEHEATVEEIDQKLSHYETKYFAGDILFLDDKELGYCLGNVVVEREERVLRQRYVINMPYDGYKSYTRTKAIKDEEIICVLNPKEELSVDDLLSLDSQTPVLWQDGDYGFFQRKDQEDKLVISTQKGLYLPSRQDSYTFQQIESGEITPRLLVPEIKSRI